MESRRIAIGHTDEFIDQPFKRLELDDGTEVVIFRRQEQYYALEDCCSHARARLSDGLLEDDRICCPLHGAAFDLATGAALSLPAIRGVRTFPVECRGNELYLTLS